jgi:hypothetical protein
MRDFDDLKLLAQPGGRSLMLVLEKSTSERYVVKCLPPLPPGLPDDAASIQEQLTREIEGLLILEH